MNKIVLASASPRRKELLTQIGLSFEVVTSNVEEIITKQIPYEIVMELSAQKALDVQQKVGKDAIVIGADTIVALGNEIMGKPTNEDDAFRMLNKLQGNTHQVYTGVTLCVGKKVTSFYEKTSVHVYEMSEQEMWSYIKTGEPMDKAGAYGIQGRFAAYVKGIEGDYNNVVGLPVARVYQELRKEKLV